MMSNAINQVFLKADGARIAIWGFALAAWIFILEYSLYLVRADVPDKLIKLGAFACILLFLRFQRNAMGTDEKKLLMLFSALLLTSLVPAILAWDGVGLLQWLKIAFMSMILAFVLLRAQGLRGQGELLTSIYLGLAAIFSLQAIIGFFAVLFNWMDSLTILEVGRRPGQHVVSLGILGIANAIQTPIEGVRVLRAQGWFVEPSILAAFLLYPAFASFGRFRQSRQVMFLMLSMAIFVAIFMTFSLAGYFAILATALFLIFSRPLYARLQQHRVMRYSYPALILILFFVLTKGILFGVHKMNEINLQEIDHLVTEGRYDKDSAKPAEKLIISSSKMFARDPQGPSGNMNREMYKVNTYKDVLLSHPVGIGLGSTLGTSEVNSANALVFWAIAGGIPAIILVLVFFWYIFWIFCHPLLNCTNVVYRCVAASFIGHAIHNMSYGNWLAPFFLLHLAIVVMSARELREGPN